MIGIFGGSFNPIHLGHLGLSRWVVDQGLVEKVWLLISPHNPLKPSAELLDEDIRLALARRAVADEAGIEASDFEFHLPRPSYTWNTLCALHRAFPQERFALMIGADNWQLFERWAHWEDILRTTPLLVYPRQGYEVCAKELPEGVRYLHDAPLFPFSSTDVRRAARARLPLQQMLPAEIVADVERYYGSQVGKTSKEMEKK